MPEQSGHLGCIDCTERPDDRCASSKKTCGHHCNHAWSHDSCCWCGIEWGEDGEATKRKAAMPAKYRKKPVVIEAVQWTGDNQQAIHDFSGGVAFFRGHPRSGFDMYVKTLEGEMHASLRDWLIKGVQGEFYACKPDIFDATYEPADA